MPHVLSLRQEAFFGKALMDMSRKALLAAGGVGDGAVRPSFGQGAPRPKVDPSVPGALQGTPRDRKEAPTHLRGKAWVSAEMGAGTASSAPSSLPALGAWCSFVLLGERPAYMPTQRLFCCPQGMTAWMAAP